MTEQDVYRFLIVVLLNPIGAAALGYLVSEWLDP